MAQHTLTIPGKPDIEWDTDNPGSVAEAEKAFNEFKTQGALAYAVSAGSPATGAGGEVIRDFDPMTDIRMQTQSAGG